MPHLKTLEVKTINDDIIDVQCISSPTQHLQSLDLMGRLEKLPDWIAGLCLLTRLALCWSRLAGDQVPLKVLQCLPNLMQLYIYETFTMAESAVNVVIDKLVPFMTSFLKDAYAKAERANMSSGVKTWVRQTREMATHIEDIIDEYLRHAARRRNKHGFTSFIHKTSHFVRGLFARHEIGSEIQLIKKRVLQIQETSVAYGFNSIEQTSFSS
ncbi:unnamed protein product [Prunus brigantina]